MANLECWSVPTPHKEKRERPFRFCPCQQLEEDRERHQRRERELTSALEQQQQAVTQAKLDADSAAQRHHRELQSLQKRFQVR